jgi:hypothetical protein
VPKPSSIAYARLPLVESLNKAGAMPTYDDFVELALICARNAHTATSRDVSAVLRRMAIEHRDKAAKLNGGKEPDIGEPPAKLIE